MKPDIIKVCAAIVLIMAVFAPLAFASETDIPLPELNSVFTIGGSQIPGRTLLIVGLLVCLLGGLFGLIQYMQVKKLPAHKSMLEVSNVIWETCKTYLIQQGKFLLALEIIIGICILYYFKVLKDLPLLKVIGILIWSVVGIAGSYGVAWFGIRMNTLSNSRTAFASLAGKPFPIFEIPLKAGMSIGLLLVSVELLIMLGILLFVGPEEAGACFIGFAIGESLGASVLRICGGIFTKIADIGSDLMKIVFNIKEDDARNPGVIADCTGDNAGDSVGPTADGFETYGVTGVALIVFICLAVQAQFQSDLIIWIFTMRVLMIITSMLSYWLNSILSRALYGKREDLDFEQPLTNLVWLTSILSILMTYLTSFLLLSPLSQTHPGLWWKLATIISCGTLAAAVIPELTKIFTSSNSSHVKEIVNASREGGASLTILSGLVAGNFSAFWMGLTLLGLMLIAWLTSQAGLDVFLFPKYSSVFAFGLVAFGFLGMGPVTIAVDSYGPVTDNAQSIYELSLIEQIPDVKEELKKDFGFEPNFEEAKHFLEKNDGAGNTFKATAKPVLIGTAVVGATTMIFSIIILLNNLYERAKAAGNVAEMERFDISIGLSLLNPMDILGLIAGGAVIYWFCGASMQAVTTGAYRAVEFIKKHIKLEGVEKASIKDSKEVVKICTIYAQNGMVNIFIVIFCFALGFACFNHFFFVSYLISIALFGLFAAVYMANAGGAWDNAKKVVEVDLKEKGTPLHAATVVGDTVGDPYKDTSSVALNPIIKFTTLFGLLAVEMAITMPQQQAVTVGVILFIIGAIFAYRSFYGMRIKTVKVEGEIEKVA
ncbi:MAG: sodium-translocating pyrophosphatase [Candidatus Eremiobacteraeota bacterium]|nr:sodium-translocating pyrophosphatase [Candidatus Eremiobacteraeota bacterium]